MLSVQLGSRSASTGPVGRLFFSLFCLVFFSLGCLFLWLIGRDVARSLATYRWTAVPCVIRASRVITDDRSENPYRFTVDYEYEVNGQKYRSPQTKLKDVRSGNYSEVLRLARQYTPEARATCFVNPRNPQEAVLQRGTLWFAFALLFPLPFILIGGGGAIGVWSKGASASNVSKPLSAPGPSPAGCAIAFFGLFLLVGIGATGALFVRPVWKILRARNWQAVPCVIVSGNVRSHSGDKGTTYSVDILYRYQVNGEEYRANRYAFAMVSSSGYQGKANIIARYPPGSSTVCYVDPRDPTEAVLNRSFSPAIWVGLVPLVFALAAGFGIVSTIRKRREVPVIIPGIESARVTGSRVEADENEGDHPETLRPRTSPAGKLLIGLMMALFWNGITSVFVFQVISGWRHGRGQIFLTLFMTPFVLIGLGFIGYVGYSFVALFSPRIRLACSSSKVLPGATVQLDWTVQGDVGKVRKLRIYLEGREEATYRRGTRSTTDRSVFASIPIVERSEELSSGAVAFTLPAEAIHSFDAANNKLIWAVWVQAEIVRMPDVKDEYPLIVLPQAVAPPIKV